jgi:hypothetical protein
MKINLQNIPAAYVENMLGIPVSVHAWANPAVPPVIQDAYNFSEMVVQGKSFVLLGAKQGINLTPRNVIAHVGWFAQKLGREAVYVATSMSTYGRKQLVAGGVSFIVPGTQLYLPTLGMTFHNRTPAIRTLGEYLSPVAHVVVLAHILGRDTNLPTATALAVRLGYTKMSIGRAIEELAACELVEVQTMGREKRIRFVCEGRELWEKAKPFLRTPVRQRVYLEKLEPFGLAAGMTALAEKTDLVAPTREVLAFGVREWRMLEGQGNLRAIPQVSDDGALLEVEVWRYDPRLLTDGKTVDPFSLFLSMDGTEDERVEAALKQLLEKAL